MNLIENKAVRLNAQQAVVVDDLAGNFLLLAPAGTGKTNTLSMRIARILSEKQAASEEILCLTFTNRACKEMLERVEAVVGEDSSGVTVRTIHGFCYHLLLEYGDELGDRAENMSICDEEDALEIIREALSSVAGIDKVHPVRIQAMVRVMDSFMEMVKHQMYRQETGGIHTAAAAVLRQEESRLRENICIDAQYLPDPKFFAFLRRSGADVMAQYQGLLLEKRLYDFHDLVLQAGLLLRRPEIHEQLRGRYRYIHVDEVQDISDIEYEILTHMAPEAVFLLAGDVHQTIYGWRGSEPMAILPRFQEEFHARRVLLEENYRSLPGLINLGQRFVAGAFTGEAPPPLRYTREEAAVSVYENEQDQTEGLFRQIAALEVDGDFSRVAVLCRSNRLCETIARGFVQCSKKLNNPSVRFMLAEEFKLFRAREIKDILAFIRTCINPGDDVSLARIAVEYAGGVGAATVKGIQTGQRDLGIRLADYFSPLTHGWGDYFGLLKIGLAQGNVVVFDVESTGVDVYRDSIIQVAAIRIDGGAAVSGSMMEYVRPAKSVGSSQRVHGLSDEFLRREGKPPVQVLEQLSRFLAGAVVVGHNVSYDLAILENELRRLGLPPIEIAGVYDTLDLARRYVADAENHKLETMAVHFDTQARPSHDAMDDILATGQVLTAIHNQFILPRELARKMAYRTHLDKFADIHAALSATWSAAADLDLPQWCESILDSYHIREKYGQEPARLENIRQFLQFLQDPVFAQGWWKQCLSRVVEYSTLPSSALDRLSKDAKKLSIITVHQAKGCEFDYVFLPSLMEYTFPGSIAIRNGSIEEEARLFYVAITRAKKGLFLSWCRNQPSGRKAQRSRFLELI